MLKHWLKNYNQISRSYKTYDINIFVNSYNYLDLLNVRQIKWLPIHFHKTKISVSEYLNIDDLEYWIGDKLNGRFYLGKIPVITPDDHLKSNLVLGFEEEKELTYFMLACPFLRRI